jgi:hypothetical protein
MQPTDNKTVAWMDIEYSMFIREIDTYTEKAVIDCRYKLPTDHFFAMRDSLHGTQEFNRCSFGTA